MESASRSDSGLHRALSGPMLWLSLAAPIVWLPLGFLPTWSAFGYTARYEDQGPPVGLALSIAATFAVELIAIVTLGLCGIAIRYRWVAWVALGGQVVLTVASLIARSAVDATTTLDSVLLVMLVVLCLCSSGATIGFALDATGRSSVLGPKAH